MTCVVHVYSHEREETRTCFEFDDSVGGLCCWFDVQACFTSFKSSLMNFTASSNVVDSHDALSSTVDCASTSMDNNVTSAQIRATRKIGQRASDIWTKAVCRFLIK